MLECHLSENRGNPPRNQKTQSTTTILRIFVGFGPKDVHFLWVLLCSFCFDESFLCFEGVRTWDTAKKQQLMVFVRFLVKFLVRCLIQNYKQVTKKNLSFLEKASGWLPFFLSCISAIYHASTRQSRCRRQRLRLIRSRIRQGCNNEDMIT